MLMKGIKYQNNSRNCTLMISRNSKLSKKLNKLLRKMPRRKILNKQLKCRSKHMKHQRNKSKRKFIKILDMNILWIKLWRKYNQKHHSSHLIHIRHSLGQLNLKIQMVSRIYGRINLSQLMDMKLLKTKRFQLRDRQKQKKKQKNFSHATNEGEFSCSVRSRIMKKEYISRLLSYWTQLVLYLFEVSNRREKKICTFMLFSFLNTFWRH